jgi:hypothetical protein
VGGLDRESYLSTIMIGQLVLLSRSSCGAYRIMRNYVAFNSAATIGEITPLSARQSLEGPVKRAPTFGRLSALVASSFIDVFSSAYDWQVRARLPIRSEERRN